MSARKRDLAWEKLVEVTGANPEFERGMLNHALKGIRDCAIGREGILEEDLPAEIEVRAMKYHEMFPGLTMTPIALARHWIRVAMPKPENVVEKWLRKLKEPPDDI